MEDGNQPEQIKTKDKNNTSLFSLYALAMYIANSLDSFQRLTHSCVLSLIFVVFLFKYNQKVSEALAFLQDFWG